MLHSFLSGTSIGSATVRGAGNVIGGGDWQVDRLIPDAVRAFSRGQPLVLRYPEAVRPWQHVLDAVQGLLVVAQGNGSPADRYRTTGTLALYPDPTATVAVLGDMIATAWGSGAMRHQGRHTLLPGNTLPGD